METDPYYASVEPTLKSRLASKSSCLGLPGTRIGGMIPSPTHRHPVFLMVRRLSPSYNRERRGLQVLSPQGLDGVWRSSGEDILLGGIGWRNESQGTLDPIRNPTNDSVGPPGPLLSYLQYKGGAH